MIAKCAACRKIEEVDRCHIKSKGAGGTWDEYNIILMCRLKHVEQHTIGWNKFIEKHPHMKLDFQEKGWEFDSYLNKWVHRA